MEAVLVPVASVGKFFGWIEQATKPCDVIIFPLTFKESLIMIDDFALALFHVILYLAIIYCSLLLINNFNQFMIVLFDCIFIIAWS